MQCSFTYIPVSCPSTSAMLDPYMHGVFDIPNRTMNAIDYCIQMKLVPDASVFPWQLTLYLALYVQVACLIWLASSVTRAEPPWFRSMWGQPRIKRL